jgi:hypothetical protein
MSGMAGKSSFHHSCPGRKTVVDMMKRGSTFGELAIIFLIPRKLGDRCDSWEMESVDGECWEV